MAKVSVPWFGNFFDGYLSAGGNGVAMRIQPHVWASFDSASDPKHLVDLLRDGVITHGHPRALVGAVLHAVALGRVMTTGQPLTEADWQQVLTKTERTAMLIEQDESLATVWLPYWENATGSQLSAAWAETVTECAEMLDAIRPSVAELKRSPDPKIYEQIITALDLRNPENVGSGTATAVAALAVSTAVPDPETASRLTANALGTDTDTIGTMVGAVCGASASAAPPSSVQDSGYLRKEAARLSDIATKRGTSGFNYADLLTWVAPNSQIDSVGLVQEQMALAGMAFLQP